MPGRLLAMTLLAVMVAPAAGAQRYGGRLEKARGTSDWPECVRLLEPLAEAGVDDPAVLSRLGLCLSMMGESARAETVLRRCVEVAPGHDGCLNDLGAVLVDQGRDREAVPYFERAVQIALAAGRYSGSLEWLIALELDRDDLQAARRHLDLARAHAPNERRRAALDLYGARLALATGDGEAALRLLGSERVRRNIPHAAFLRSLVLAWLGRFEEAATAAPRPGRSAGEGSGPGEALRRLAPQVFAAEAPPAELDELVRRFPSDQRSWFLAAVAAHLRGDDAVACRLLAEARSRVEGSRSLLAPPWAACTEGEGRRSGGGKP